MPSALSQGGDDLRNPKILGTLSLAQVGLHWTLMLHTKAGHPTAPWRSLYSEEAETFLDAYLAFTNIPFPTSPSSKPLTMLPLPATVLRHARRAQVHSGEEQKSKDPGMWHRTEVRNPQEEAQPRPKATLYI